MFERRDNEAIQISPTGRAVAQTNGATINIEVVIEQKNYNGWNCGSELEAMRRCKMLIEACKLQFPGCELQNGRVIAPTETGWSEFTTSCTDNECEQAITILHMIACAKQIDTVTDLEQKEIGGCK